MAAALPSDQERSGEGNFSSTSGHYYYMDCDTIRVAISTQIDGEVPWLPADVLETHLAGCPACLDWQRRAHTVTRRVRLGGAFLDHDLTPAVLAAVPVAHDRGRLRLARRGLLIALALAQLAIAVPMLFLGHDHDAGVHAAHELGSFNLALAIAFAVGAVRPKLSAGLAWPCGIAAGGLVTTAIIDLIGGQAIGADEAQHLVALAGAALLVWQSRGIGTETAALAIVPGEGPARNAGRQSRAGPGRTARRRARSPVGRRRRPRDQPGHRRCGCARQARQGARRGGRVTPSAPIADPAAVRKRAVGAPSDVGPADAGKRQVELAIEGMTCAACAVRIEKKLTKLDDVQASVNYATGTARVTAPAAMPTEELIAAVVRAGYTATAPRQRAGSRGRGPAGRRGRRQARRLPEAHG